MNTVLTAADLATAGTLTLTAVNGAPGGGTSSAASLPVNSPVVNNPAPTLISVAPATVSTSSSTPIPITVTGTNFVQGSVINVGTTAHATTFVNSTQLTSALTPYDIADPGKLSITVTNPASGGISNAGSITVTVPVPPQISNVSPGTFYVGATNATISVYGLYLEADCKILWNGTAVTTTASVPSGYVSGLQGAIPSSLLMAAGTASVSVNCPSNVPPASNTVPVTVIVTPAPTLSNVSPAAAPIGTDVTVTLNGNNLFPNSVVTYNGATLPAKYNGYSLSVTIPAGMNVVPGMNSFTVTTPGPGGGTSAGLPFASYVALSNNDMIYNPVNGLFYASVPSTAGATYGNSIVSIDPATGALGTPIRVGSEPDHLALTSDGRYLWVGLDGANAVRKVDLTAGTAGLQFAIPQQTANPGSSNSAYALVALPGATDSVIVSSANFPNYFAIYDSGVVRGTPISGYYTQPYAILTDGSKNEVYAAGINSYQTFTYSSAGLTLKGTSASSITVPSGGDMQIAGGKLYPSDGKVYDPESGALLATLYVTGSTVASGTTFADPALGKIFVADYANGTYTGTSQNQIQIFSSTDYTTTTAIPVTVAASGYTFQSPNRLSRWGSNGLAMRTSAGLFSLRSNLVKDLSGTSADLGVTITSTGTTTGAPVTFTATVTNNGGSAATNVTLAAALPSNASLVSATSTAGSCSAVTTLACDLGSLANGATATITVTLQPISAGNLTFATQVAGSENDPVAANNSASATVAITGSAYNPAPTVTSITPAAIKAGSSDTILTVNGTGFNTGSAVNLGGSALVTTLISGTQMTAVVPAASLAQMGWAPVTVSNRTPGGGTSNPQPLTVFSVVSAGLNHIAYEPFSRKIFATVGSGSTSLTGNSIAQLTPETGTFNTPASIGSQPTRFSISSDGLYLYAVLSGANKIARVNIPGNALDFTFAASLPSSGYFYDPVLTDVVVQPGSDTALAVNYGSLGLVDVDPVAKTATLRGGTVAGYNPPAGGAARFSDAGTLYVYDGALEKYTALSAGLSNTTPHTTLYVQPFDVFGISGNYAYADTGGLADVSGPAPVQVGTFTFLNGVRFYQKVAGDASLGRAFFAEATSSSLYPDGIVAYDQATLNPVLTLPLNMSTIEGTSQYNVVDLIRWGQDGLALLTDTGHVYLLRGAAVVPQLLNTNTAATLNASSATTITHGAANTLLTLTGTNFLPGVAVDWNGAYRTTTRIDSTHVTVAIPASDLLTAGTATLTAVNPGAAASAGLTFTIN